MTNSLSERIKEAMKGPPKISGVALAEACSVAAASVSDWRSGKTQTIEGSNLLKAAEFLGVRAKWLAEGLGPMRDTVFASHAARQSVSEYNITKKHDKMTTELVTLFNQLDKPSKHEYLGQLRGFVMGRSVHGKDPPLEQTPPANNERTGTHD